MSPFRICFFAFVVFLLPVASFAEDVPIEKVAVAKPIKKIPTQKKWHIGLGYLQWNEKISLTRADQVSRGFANYAGAVVSLERTWARPTLQWGLGLFMGSGRATAGGFDGTLEFTDGINRGWKTQGANLFIDRMVNQSVGLGVGVMGSFRQANWEPLDQTLTVLTREPVTIATHLDLRLQISGKVTLIQTITPLSFRGESQWLWIAQYAL